MSDQPRQRRIRYEVKPGEWVEALVTDPERFWGWKPARHWLPPLILFVTLLIGHRLAPDKGSQPFYEAAAQILPVIMLTLAIEARAFEWNLEWRGWAHWWADPLTPRFIGAASRVIVLGLLVAAELKSVAKLSDPASLPDGQPRFVFAAMLTGFIAVALAAIPRRAPRPEERGAQTARDTALGNPDAP